METAPHTDTHTDENKTQMFYWTLAARERDELGSRLGWVPARWRGLLRGAAPANSRAARPTVTRVGLVPMEELESSSRSPRTGIRVVDKTQQNSNERPTQNCNESSNECSNECSNRTAMDAPTNPELIFPTQNSLN